MTPTSHAYLIKWKSRIDGRAGRSSKEFASREEVERLVGELNKEYPQILHTVIEAPPPTTESTSAETGVGP